MIRFTTILFANIFLICFLFHYLVLGKCALRGLGVSFGEALLRKDISEYYPIHDDRYSCEFRQLVKVVYCEVRCLLFFI